MYVKTCSKCGSDMVRETNRSSKYTCVCCGKTIYTKTTINDRSIRKLELNVTGKLTPEEIKDKFIAIENLPKNWRNEISNKHGIVHKSIIEMGIKLANRLIFVGDIKPRTAKQINFIYQVDLMHKVQITIKEDCIAVVADSPDIPYGWYNHYIKNFYYDGSSVEESTALFNEAVSFLNAILIYYLNLKLKDYMNVISERTAEIIINKECCAKVPEEVLTKGEVS